MSGQALQIDIAIIGGGVAGLWALNQLRQLGYSVALFEQEALGSYQSIGSQGMIHGGVKYALAGSWSKDAEAISTMPALWRQCLNGTGKIDLRGCKVLSEEFFLWSDHSLPARLGTFLAGKLLRGQVNPVAAADHPAALRSTAFKGKVYRLADLVVDVRSLVETLASRHRDAIFSIDWQRAALRRDGRRAVLELGQHTLLPAQLLLSAGAGNAALLARLGSRQPAMQRRPLQQVLVRHQYSEPFYGHCVGSKPSPRLTISSHRDHRGQPIWYLGGDLSTGAADETQESLIAHAKDELAALLPWLDLGATEWATLRLDRAEPKQASGQRPERAFVGKLDGVDNVRAAWPTKLTLCPDLGNQIERQLAREEILPRHRPDLSALASLGRPRVAVPYWDTLLP